MKIETVGERVRALRKAKNMTQQKLADCLGVKRNTVAQWESGINPVTDIVIASICREFSVNESWLRTGEGDMFRKLTRSQEISEFTADILREENDSFKRRFVAMLSKLDEDDWALLAKMAQELAKE